MRAASLARVHRRRAATQRVTGAPVRRGADAVRLLLAVQAQDAPMAAWSLGLRTRAGTTYADVLAEQAAGGWVRAHVLRPTWHLVAPEDLRWLQRLTGPKVEGSMGARHRQLDLDAAALDRAVDALRDLLGGGPPTTRRELTAAFGARGLPSSGEQMAHQLLVAELRAVICSGPPRGVEHTYLLVEDAVATGPLDRLEGEEARAELVRRFMAGHGPATDRDLARWSTLTLTEIRAALADLGDRLACIDVEGSRMWFDPTVPARTTRSPGAVLVPTFDELTLTYADHGHPRRDPGSARPRLVNAIGGGTVLLDGGDVGAWSRRVTRTAVEVDVAPDLPLTTAESEAVAAAAERLGAFLGLPARLSIGRAS
jgi:hypothetical protein